MRKFLLFWFLLTTFLRVASQNLNIAHHTCVDNALSLVSINAKCYYLEKIIFSCCNEQANVVALNDSGNIIFKTSFHFSDFNRPKKLIKTKDKALAFIGSTENCDVATNPGYKNFLIKLDTNGVIQFQTFIQYFYTIPVYGLTLDYIKDFIQYSDSSYYLVSDSLLYHYSKTGQFVSKINTGFSQINSITYLNSGNLLLNGTLNSVLKNVEVTNTCSIVNQQTTNTGIKKFIQTPGGTLFGLTGLSTLESYSQNLLAINNSTNSINTSNRFTDFAIRNDSVFATGNYNQANMPFYRVLDQSFNTLYQSQAAYKDVSPSGIALNNKSKINIVTTSASSNLFVSFTSLYQMPVSGSFSSTPDIGVAGFSVVSAQYPINYSSQAPGYIAIGFYTLDVKIKNHTKDTVKSFYLNYYFTQQDCWSLYHQLFTDLILPYDSIVLQNVMLTGNTAIINNNALPGYQDYQPICLFTTIPNSENDININNDSYCDSILVKAVLTGLPATIKINNSIDVFPNPFTNQLIIESSDAIKHMALLNSSGMLIKEINPNSSKVILDNLLIPVGIYLLKIETEKGVSIKKVVKN